MFTGSGVRYRSDRKAKMEIPTYEAFIAEKEKEAQA
jgi:hypothetical protein